MVNGEAEEIEDVPLDDVLFEWLETPVPPVGRNDSPNEELDAVVGPPIELLFAIAWPVGEAPIG